MSFIVFYQPLGNLHRLLCSRTRYLLLCIAFLFFFSAYSTSAAKLPNQTPENQAFAIDSVLDATGMITDDTRMNWVIVSPGSIPTGILGAGQSISLLDYSDHIRTNGGKTSENKEFTFNSKDQTDPLRNIKTEKILTYVSSDGAHLEGEEALSLDVAGNFSPLSDSVRCVFMRTPSSYVPAFCTKVTGKSELVSFNNGQVSTKGESLAVADSIDDPLVLSYRIAVTPDKESLSADGTVKTFLSMGVMESRDVGTNSWNKTASTITWTDTAAVTGGIRNFQKDYTDPSGFQSGFFPPIGDTGPEMRVIPTQTVVPTPNTTPPVTPTTTPTTTPTPGPTTGSVKFHVNQIGTSQVTSVTAFLDGTSLGNLASAGSSFERTFSDIPPGSHSATITTSPTSTCSAPVSVNVNPGTTSDADFTYDYSVTTVTIILTCKGGISTTDVSATIDSETKSTWVSTAVTHNLVFTDIHIGTHTFSMTASNSNGSVTIAPPPPSSVSVTNGMAPLMFLIG